MNGRYLNHRNLRERIVVQGTLVLESPTHFGNGDAEGVADMPLMRDPLTGRPLLTGASIAGALRNYVREVERGYGQAEVLHDPRLTERVFGYAGEDDEGEASVLSWLMADDAIGEDIGTELRDGVAIEPTTRTAEDRKKFDIELLPTGMRFPISVELLVPDIDEGVRYVETLALSLHGLQQGEIGLGQRKRRGYGRCRAEGWRVRRFSMETVDGLLGWLRDDAQPAEAGADIVALLLKRDFQPDDARERLTLTAHFALSGPLIIRSGSGEAEATDLMHLRDFVGRPILPGTSWAGVLRGRATRIAHTIAPMRARAIVDSMFGPRLEEGSGQMPVASRLWVQESVIDASREMVQSRVKIDRFTGGAFPQHLFSEQPLTAGEVTLSLSLRQPTRAEAGLLLLLLKDLWTGDLPVGGESGTGRGRLRGLSAEMAYAGQRWHFQQEENELKVRGDRAELENLVQALSAVTEVSHD